MSRQGKCAKCGGKELIRVPIMPGEGPHIAVGDRLMHPVPLRQIVCAACGYIETWVEGADDLANLRAEYGQR